MKYSLAAAALLALLIGTSAAAAAPTQIACEAGDWHTQTVGIERDDDIKALSEPAPHGELLIRFADPTPGAPAEVVDDGSREQWTIVAVGGEKRPWVVLANVTRNGVQEIFLEPLSGQVIYSKTGQFFMLMRTTAAKACQVIGAPA